MAIPAVAGLLVILPCQLCMVNCYWLPQSMAYYFPRGFVYSADVDDGLCVYSGLCVHMWRLVHQWSFLLFWLSWLNLTIDTLYQSISIVKNSQNHWCTNRHRSTKTVSTVYQSSKTVKNCQKTVKTAKMTIGVPIVICLPRLYQRCTNCQKQSKQQKLPLVYQSSHVYTESAEYTKSASASAEYTKPSKVAAWTGSNWQHTNQIYNINWFTQTADRKSK